jgi:hypothetical protein
MSKISKPDAFKASYFRHKRVQRVFKQQINKSMRHVSKQMRKYWKNKRRNV